MSDAADPTPTVPELLLALQAIDTETDQLEHRRERSPLRDEFEAAAGQLRSWERTRNEINERIAELDRSIEESEATGEQLQEHRARLQQQLKTVIAPREAEALMQEITTLEQQVDELDDAELEALEEQSALDDRRAAHLREQESVATAMRLADDALAAEVAQIDERLAALGEERTHLRAGLPEPTLATYDRKRAALGVAVAALVGKQCQGCHLELSAAEIDTVKEEAAATGVTDCTDCGRLLIV